VIRTPEAEETIEKLRVELPEGSFINCVWVRSTKTNNEFKVFTKNWLNISEDLGKLGIGTFVKDSLTMPDVLRIYNGGTCREIAKLLGKALYDKEHNAIIGLTY
jgi:hypothetical protein